jgi:SAM-dependent methyltransferase
VYGPLPGHPVLCCDHDKVGLPRWSAVLLTLPLLHSMDLQQSWEGEAAGWVAYARDPARDAPFWFHNLPAFLDLLPHAGKRTLDVGCGEGRLPRQLAGLGHRVVGIDGSPTMAKAMATHPDGVPVAIADAARLPFGNRTFDLVVVFMVLHDVDRMEEVVQEAARVTSKGGRVCIAIPHPIQGIGDFAGKEGQRRYVIDRPYFEHRRLTCWLGEGVLAGRGQGARGSELSVPTALRVYERPRASGVGDRIAPRACPARGRR